MNKEKAGGRADGIHWMPPRTLRAHTFAKDYETETLWLSSPDRHTKQLAQQSPDGVAEGIGRLAFMRHGVISVSGTERISYNASDALKQVCQEQFFFLPAFLRFFRLARR